MSAEIIVAFIALGSTLVVALLSLITSMISNRQSSRSLQIIEHLKDDLERQRVRQEKTDNYLESSLKSLQVMIQVIQRLKDEMQIIQVAIFTSLDTETALSRVKEIREEIIISFGKNISHLNDFEYEICHKAKNRSILIENYYRQIFQEKTYVSEMSNEERQQMTEQRNLLTDFQQSLRDSREERITGRYFNDGPGKNQ